MSGLVGNPEDRFSHDRVQISNINFISIENASKVSPDLIQLNESVREKINNLGSDQVRQKQACTSTKDG